MRQTVQKDLILAKGNVLNMWQMYLLFNLIIDYFNRNNLKCSYSDGNVFASLKKFNKLHSEQYIYK